MGLTEKDLIELLFDEKNVGEAHEPPLHFFKEKTSRKEMLGGGRRGGNRELGKLVPSCLCRGRVLRRFAVVSVESQQSEAARVENVGLAWQLRHESTEKVLKSIRSLVGEFFFRQGARCVIGNRVPAVCGCGRAVDCDQALAEKFCRAGERGAERCVHEVLPGKVNPTLVQPLCDRRLPQVVFRHVFLTSEQCSVAINYHTGAFSSRMVDIK